MRDWEDLAVRFLALNPEADGLAVWQAVEKAEEEGWTEERLWAYWVGQERNRRARERTREVPLETALEVAEGFPEDQVLFLVDLQMALEKMPEALAEVAEEVLECVAFQPPHRVVSALRESWQGKTNRPQTPQGIRKLVQRVLGLLREALEGWG